MVNNKPYVKGWHLDAMDDHLEALKRGDIKNLVITMPPRHTKSIKINVMFPAWVWADEPFQRFMHFTYHQRLTVRDSVACRKVIESPGYQALFGGKYQLVSDQNTKIRFDNDQNGSRLSSAVSGGATGEGGNYMIIDDPHNAFEISSERAIEMVVEDWWQGAISTRDDDMETRRLLVMQRLRINDLVGHVLDHERGWVHLDLPMEYEPSRSCVTVLGWKDPRTEPGELLWPERYDKERVEVLRERMGTAKFEAQMNQNPKTPEGKVIKKVWVRYYKESTRVKASQCDVLIFSWDMPFKKVERQRNAKGRKKKDSDYLVGQVWGKKGADRFLIDQIRLRADFTKALEVVVQFAKKWPNVRDNLMEDKAYAPAIISTLQKHLKGIIPVEPQGDKLSRLESVAYLWEAGNCYVPDPEQEPWVEGYVERLTDFPDVDYDDEIDTTSQGLRRWENFSSIPIIDILGL